MMPTTDRHSCGCATPLGGVLVVILLFVVPLIDE